jgi:hypothetical protein
MSGRRGAGRRVALLDIDIIEQKVIDDDLADETRRKLPHPTFHTCVAVSIMDDI